MSYLNLFTMDGPSGTVAVQPDAVVVIWKTGDTSELHLTSHVRVPISIDAKSAAKALWGFYSETDDGCFNDSHVIAVVPNGSGSRILLTGDIKLDNPMPINAMIMWLRKMEADRAQIRARGQAE